MLLSIIPVSSSERSLSPSTKAAAVAPFLSACRARLSWDVFNMALDLVTGMSCSLLRICNRVRAVSVLCLRPVPVR